MKEIKSTRAFLCQVFRFDNVLAINIAYFYC